MSIYRYRSRYEDEPQLSVGIVSGEKIEFSLDGCYEANGETVGGNHVASLENGLIHWQGRPYTQLVFRPVNKDYSFVLKDVTIGVNFHWQRQETQRFLGTLRLVADGGKLVAVNDLPVERYLESVISSEMSATSNMPLLMAHAVISRSWLMAQIEKKYVQTDGGATCGEAGKKVEQGSGVAVRDTATIDRLVRWYDRQDHTLFDVCADDHCQRYQGITKETSRNAAEAVRRTRGQILTYGDEICDARFSKSCGGAMEEFQFCWEDTPKAYLKGIGDTVEGNIPDLTVESEAERWIRSTPDSFCNTHDAEILSQVLNDYDQETTDFYRWHVDYTQEQLSELIARKTGIDFGDIVDLVPMKRGTSGRLCELKIIGTKRTMVIGKELEIRRALSESHLYSSAFVVDKVYGDSAIPVRFHIVGAGWGHGVGLCQIGAAVMGAKGYAYDEILSHYYPNSTLSLAWQ